jgi:tellurite resistance protein TerC
VTLREAALWSTVYIGIAVLFGLGVLVFGSVTMGAEYFAGYVTEKALSVDNLFVFLVVMSSFKVPRADQQKVLLFGIVFSLIARTGFILLGAALINLFAWVFYIFGLILLVMVAIGGTDLLFALDSIPAIFGLTQSVFLVFTATAFSLLGLRQLYFLIDGLLNRLIYLSYGLAAILAFIGVKLVLHALHENNVLFVNNGQPIEVAEISTGLSLAVIFGVLIVTIVASLTSTWGRAQNVICAARRHATEHLEIETDHAHREQIFAALCAEEMTLKRLPEKHRARSREEEQLMSLLRRAHAAHEEASAKIEA